MRPNFPTLPSPLAEPQTAMAPPIPTPTPTPYVDPTTATLSSVDMPYGAFGGKMSGQKTFGVMGGGYNQQQPMGGLMGGQSSGVEQLLQPFLSQINSQIQQQAQQDMKQKIPAYVQQISEITNTTFPNLFANGIGSIPNQFTNSLRPYQNQMNPMMANLFK